MEDYTFFYTLLGLAMLTGQIMAIVIMFGGRKNATKQWKIAIGISLILMFLAIMGLAMNS